MQTLSLEYTIFIIIIFFFCYSFIENYRKYILLIGSIVFYTISAGYFVLMIGLVVIFTHYYASRVDREPEPKKRLILTWIGVGLNLFVLILFKYAFFILGLFIDLFLESGTGFITDLRLFENDLNSLVITLGLSYIIFQAISYMIDVYTEEVKFKNDFLSFALYLFYFPKVVAGPIETASPFLEQIAEPKRFDSSRAISGLKIFFSGLFMKIVIADRISPIVSTVYDNPENFSGPLLLFATLLFTIQLYADFAGYTNMAIGISRLFGIELTQNFNRPFFSRNMAEFWRRWHITLSNWLNRYLFTPLSFSFRGYGVAGMVLSVLITFFICGLWHGASVNFIVFGLLNGVGVLLGFLSRNWKMDWLPKAIQTIIFPVMTFLFFSFTLIFFRSNDFATASQITLKLFSGYSELTDLNLNVIKSQMSALGVTQDYMILTLILILSLFLYEFFSINRVQLFSRIWKLKTIRYMVYYVMLFLLIYLNMSNSAQDFIYTQF